MSSANAQAETGGDIEERKERLHADLRAKQRLIPAIGMGLLSVIAGIAFWAFFTSLTGRQFAAVAVVIGFLAAYCVRRFGNAVSPLYGVIGAVYAFLGALAGSIISLSVAISKQGKTGFLDFWSRMEVNDIFRLLSLLKIFDFLVYAIAIYIGYRFAFKKLADEDLEQMVLDAQSGTKKAKT